MSSSILRGNTILDCLWNCREIGVRYYVREVSNDTGCGGPVFFCLSLGFLIFFVFLSLFSWLCLSFSSNILACSSLFLSCEVTMDHGKNRQENSKTLHWFLLTILTSQTLLRYLSRLMAARVADEQLVTKVIPGHSMLHMAAPNGQ